jgi:hypothetical protein
MPEFRDHPSRAAARVVGAGGSEASVIGGPAAESVAAPPGPTRLPALFNVPPAHPLPESSAGAHRPRAPNALRFAQRGLRLCLAGSRAPTRLASLFAGSALPRRFPRAPNATRAPSVFASLFAGSALPRRFPRPQAFRFARRGLGFASPVPPCPQRVSLRSARASVLPRRFPRPKRFASLAGRFGFASRCWLRAAGPLTLKASARRGCSVACAGLGNLSPQLAVQRARSRERAQNPNASNDPYWRVRS